MTPPTMAPGIITGRDPSVDARPTSSKRESIMRLAIEESVQLHGDLCEQLDGQHLFVTGASGFFGTWVLMAITVLRARGVDVRATALSRNANARRWPDSIVGANAGIEFVSGDVTVFESASERVRYTGILHMAASSNAAKNLAAPDDAFMTSVLGMQAMIRMARCHELHLHFVSSGAVYGERLESDGPCREGEEDHALLALLDPRNSYAHAKRAAETLLCCGTPDMSISRPFAFMGPGLPLDQHFAAGNFISDALEGRTIRVRSDGRSIRSYQHPADLAIWLLLVCARRQAGLVLNVGSTEPISIAALAARIARSAHQGEPMILGKTQPASASAYWPATDRASGLGLRSCHDLDRCIGDMLTWHKSGEK